MHNLDGMTIYQQVGLVRACVGDVSLRLQPYDEIIKVMISPTRCGITVRRWTVTDRATETRLTQPRQVTRAWTCDDAGTWSPVIMEVDGRRTAEFSIDDDTVKQCLIVSHRGGKSPAEYRAQLIWDELCYRPGAGRLGQRDADMVAAETARRWNRAFGSGSYERGDN
jgi:hypothetical protein